MRQQSFDESGHYWQNLPRFLNASTLTGQIRTSPDDFRVDEQLSFAPTGSGEHVYLNVTKVNTNTKWLAEQFAKHASVKKHDIGYAGLKDRYARTSQWFSVYLANHPEPDWSAMQNENLIINERTRHKKKLRRGCVKQNHFRIVVAHVTKFTNEFGRRVEKIQKKGFPNYFGPQRFGKNLSNVRSAIAHIARQQQAGGKVGMALSAARSYLFNKVLADRVANRTWLVLLDDEVCILDGSNSMFRNDGSSDLVTRMQSGDLHTSGILWGCYANTDLAAPSLFEQKAVKEFAELADSIQATKVSAARRALRAIPGDLRYKHDDGQLIVEFSLPAGCYATSLLRELVRVVDKEYSD